MQTCTKNSQTIQEKDVKFQFTLHFIFNFNFKEIIIY